MPEGDEPIVSPYEEAMNALSSLITKRSRADKSNMGDRFDLMFDYVKMLDLEETISKLKIIHVAGTKGKGSTCTFAESILRHFDLHTGLFTSPHLIDVRERFRLNGVEICEEKFLAYFWWCWDRLKGKCNDAMLMPTYFRFLTLLAFKIFSEEQVDVAILEVGLGGKFDATNVVQKPVVCGITSLGYDHMEILGNTLGQIAGEKAGIFKPGVPAFTVDQPREAMEVLREKAFKLNVHLQVTTSLGVDSLNGLHLGLDGEHQFLNAGLAVALCSAWLQRTGHSKVNYLDSTSSLPEPFIRGLTTATLQGRANIIPDQHIDNPEDLVFHLDGAHSPESMEVCAKWFCSVSLGPGERSEQKNFRNSQNGEAIHSHKLADNYGCETPRKVPAQILLFNCMSVRDPQLLLPRLIHTCANQGVHFRKALFVPNMSVYNKVSSAMPLTDAPVDLSWQRTIQKVWDNTINSEKGTNAKGASRVYASSEDRQEMCSKGFQSSTVFPSLPLAINWLRDTVRQDRSVRLQVLVTGSLHLVGDLQRLVKK